MFLSSISVALVSLSLIATTKGQSCGNIKCDDVHFFLARGNNEPYPGRQGDLVAATCNGLSSCGYEDLVYSTLYTDLSCQSTYDGAIAGHKQMAAYASACPNSKLILAGYSEGANVATDILGGGGGVSFNGCVEPETPAMVRNTKPGSQIAAAIVFGNERHTGGQSYNFGNGSAIDGLFPRPASQLAGLNAYAGVLRDWCLANDPICAAHQPDFSVAAHLGYYKVYSNAAASWIKSVASLTDDSNRVTAIPTSVSGTVQDYATVPTGTPSGTVILDTTWTSFTFVVPCTGVSSASVSQTSSSSVASSSSLASSTSVSSSSAVLTTRSVLSSSSASGSGSESSSMSSSSVSESSVSGSQSTTTSPVGASAKTSPPATLSSATTTRTSSSAAAASTSLATRPSSGARQTFGASILLTLGMAGIVSIWM